MKIYNIILVVFLSIGITQASTYKVHLVKDGDTLSQILFNLDYTPIYDKNGSLENTINQNSELQQDNGNLIFPDQKIEVVYAGEILTTRDQEELQSINLVKRKIQGHKQLTFSLLSGYGAILEVNNNSQSGEALSNLYYGIGIKWRRKLTTLYGVSASFDYIKIDFENSEDSKLSNKGHNLTRLGLAIDRNLYWASLEVGYNLKDQLFFQTISSDKFKLNTIKDNQIYIQLEKDIYSLNKSIYSLGLLANYNILNSTKNIDIGSGYGGKAFIKYKKQNKDNSIAAALSYESNIFNSSGTEINDKLLMLRLDYEIDFFKDGK